MAAALGLPSYAGDAFVDGVVRSASSLWASSLDFSEAASHRRRDRDRVQTRLPGALRGGARGRSTRGGGRSRAGSSRGVVLVGRWPCFSRGASRATGTSRKKRERSSGSSPPTRFSPRRVSRRARGRRESRRRPRRVLRGAPTRARRARWPPELVTTRRRPTRYRHRWDPPTRNANARRANTANDRRAGRSTRSIRSIRSIRRYRRRYRRDRVRAVGRGVGGDVRRARRRARPSRRRETRGSDSRAGRRRHSSRGVGTVREGTGWTADFHRR